MTSKVTTEGTTTVESVVYDYNLQNRLAKVTTTKDPEGTPQTTVIEYQYNPDGIRVEKKETTSDGKTETHYLVDPANHTGYAQMLEETTKRYDSYDILLSTERIQYIIGDDVISQTKSTLSGTTWTANPTQYLLYDGHGSTRQLVNANLSIQDTYSYDGYGVLLQETSTELQNNPAITPEQATSLLYAGEQFDFGSQHYYNRARWYNPMNGRFNQVDLYQGNTQDPQGLHKYLYCHANPVNGIDPSGQFTINEQMMVTFIRGALLVLNVYGFVTNTFAAANNYFKSLRAFERGEILAGITYAALSVFHTGMAALNLFGIRSFIKSPPNISGGLGFSFQGGALAVSFQQLAISNPAALIWIAGELAPAVIGVFASRIHIQGQGNLLGEPGGRSRSGKTNGVLDDGSGEFPEFQSGENGPAKQFWGQPGFDYFARTHAEAHAVAWMRLKDIRFAILRINNTLCDKCMQNLKYMLGPGRSLDVIDINGKVTSFVGE